MKERNIGPALHIDNIIEGLTWQIPLPQRVYEYLGWKEQGYNNEVKTYTKNNNFRFTYIEKNELMFPNEVCYRTTYEGKMKEIK